MSTSFSGIVRALALVATVTVAAACSEHRTAERADSDLAHDLALAGQINAQPALTDTAVAPTSRPAGQDAPAASTRPESRSPAPAPMIRPAAQPPAETSPQPPATAANQQPDSSAMDTVARIPDPMVIGAGTGIALNSGMRVCTNTNKVGDKLVATVTSPATGTGGAVIPIGSRVVLELTRVNPGESSDSSAIVFQPTTVYVNGTAYPVMGTVTASAALQRAETPTTGASDKEKVVGGAVAGAILGQIFGRSTKSTVIGAAAGAATGAAVARAQQHYQSCLPEGTPLTLTLSDPVTMH